MEPEVVKLLSSSVHEVLLAELFEWSEDVLNEASTGARAVVVRMPKDSGRTTLLRRLAAGLKEREHDVVVIDVADLSFIAQAMEAVSALDRYAPTSSLRSALGLDTPVGRFGAAISAATLFVSPPLAAGGYVANALVSVAAHRLKDQSAIALERVRLSTTAVARKSATDGGVVVLVDDGEEVEIGLLRALLDGLVSPYRSKVLVVALVADGSDHGVELTRDQYGLVSERTHIVESGIDDSFAGRVDVCAELLGRWPPNLIERLCTRVSSIGEVFQAAQAPGVADILASTDQHSVVDDLVDSTLERPAVTRLQAAIGWVGGVAHVDQLVAFGQELGEQSTEGLRTTSTTVRISDLNDPRLPAAIAAHLSSDLRDRLATRAIEVALRLAEELSNDHTARAVAGAPVWHLVHEGMDIDADVERILLAVAEAAVARGQHPRAREIALQLAAARSAQNRPVTSGLVDLLGWVDELGAIGDAIALDSTTAVRLALARLRDPATRSSVVDEIDEIIIGIDTLDVEEGAALRILLAGALCRAEYPTIAEKVLQPLLVEVAESGWHQLAQLALGSGTAQGEHRASRAVLRARYEETPSTEVATRANIAEAIAELSHSLGDVRSALRFGTESLVYKETTLGAEHRGTLSQRNSVANWTGESGNREGALQLAKDLLVIQDRVLGADHPDTLVTRNNIAFWTAETGAGSEALRLFVGLLPDQERVLGADDRATLNTRNNVASWTGEMGDGPEALRLFKDLLSDQLRALQPDDPSNLVVRHNIAYWTAKTGNYAQAVTLFGDLFQAQKRILGADHPRVLRTRGNIAFWTGEMGDGPKALRLFTQLLSDQERVQGTDSTDALLTRGKIAYWIHEKGQNREALGLFEALLKDQLRVLGAKDPATLKTVQNIAALRSRIACAGQPGPRARQ